MFVFVSFPHRSERFTNLKLQRCSRMEAFALSTLRALASLHPPCQVFISLANFASCFSSTVYFQSGGMPLFLLVGWVDFWKETAGALTTCVCIQEDPYHH